MKFRHTNFMRLIYATLLALPFVAILSRVIYVQSNKNAYQSAEITQSYYQRYAELNTNEVNSIDDIIDGNYYTLELTQESGEPNEITIFDNIQDNLEIYFYTNWNNISYNQTQFSSPADYKNYFSFFDYQTPTYMVLGGYYLDYNYFSYNNSLPKTFYFRLHFLHKDNITFNLNNENVKLTALIDEMNNITYTKVESTTLDNVFEYSVNKFIENNNFGKINLFQWTTNLFFDNNDVNNMYVGFINWYLNYTLLVSATYILFLVLMWFINYARRLLERGMNYDF